MNRIPTVRGCCYFGPGSNVGSGARPGREQVVEYRVTKLSRLGCGRLATGAFQEKGMDNISLRAATDNDAAFALHVTEACMRVYAEQTYGSWNGRADLDLAFDKIVELAGRGIGMIGVDRRSDDWFLDKLYLLPTYQRQGIGSYLLQRLIGEAKSAQVVLRLTVLEVNPARRFYERHGFVLTHTVSPRHHMEWRPLSSGALVT